MLCCCCCYGDISTKLFQNTHHKIKYLVSSKIAITENFTKWHMGEGVYNRPKKSRIIWMAPCLVAGLDATQMEKSEIMNDAKSVKRWAASVAMARLCARTPPTISTTMKKRQRTLAMINLRRARLSTLLTWASGEWQWSSERNCSRINRRRHKSKQFRQVRS